MRLVAAAVQMTSGGELGRNLDRAAELVLRARARGAELVVLPENFALLAEREEAKLQHADAIDPPGEILSRMMEVARQAGAWVVLGGMPERAPEAGHVYNTCALLAPDGSLRDRYRKIHLFDVAIPDGATYHESKSVSPGDEVHVSATPWGGLGLSVCYDLRFPELFRALALGGARIVALPSAFTLPTTRAHWEILVRARAIENEVFVVAANQVGPHPGGSHSGGRSLIVDPWGEVLARAEEGEGWIAAELDFERQLQIRAQLPVLAHRRSDVYGDPRGGRA